MTALLGREVPAHTHFQRGYARPGFGDGLIRFVGDRNIGPRGLPAHEWNGPRGWRTSWPGRPKLSVFAYDWLARQYALDAARSSADDEPLVSLLDPSDGAVMESDMTFGSFIELLTGPQGDGILDKSLHRLARGGRHGACPAPMRCVQAATRPRRKAGRREHGARRHGCTPHPHGANPRAARKGARVAMT